MFNFKQFLELKDAKHLQHVWRRALEAQAVRTQQKIYNRIVDFLEDNDQEIGSLLNLVGNPDQDCFRFGIAHPLFLDFNDEADHEIQFHPVFNARTHGKAKQEFTVEVKLVIIHKEHDHASEIYTENMLMSFTAHQMELLQKSWSWLNKQYQQDCFANDVITLERKSV